MRCSLVEPPVVSRSTKTIGTSRAGCGRNCSDMERDTLDAWLCGKYAPVSRRAPSQYCFALSPCGTKTAFLHELGFVHKPVNYYIFMLAILDPKAKFYAPDLYK